VQVEFQEALSFNRLKINGLDCVLESVRLGQIGLPRWGIWRTRMKIGGMARSARRRTSCPKPLPVGVETIEFRSPTIVPI